MPENGKPKIIVILGPTAIGKTETALKLAQRYGGEIISADSMQVYRYMDIGTAKPSLAEQSLVPHHLLDIVDPDEPFNVALYCERAGRMIATLRREGKRIFVVGGTGLYIRALLGGLVGSPGPDEGLRARYKAQLASEGVSHLHELLHSRDPQAAARINPHDYVRIIRALEVMDLTGESIIKIQADHRFAERRYTSLKIGLKLDRESLFARIEARVEAMLAAGLVDEVAALIAGGYSESLKPMQSLGYRQIGEYLKGKYDFTEAVRSLKRETRHYAKRQLTWFSPDPEINWFRPADPEGPEAIEKCIEDFLHGEFS